MKTLVNFLKQYRTVIFVASGILILARLFNKFWMNKSFYSSKQSMKGKTVVITGGNAGIGYETAKDLLQRGARIILACRNLTKGAQAVEQLLSETNAKKTNLRLMQCDLSSFDSIRQFTKNYNDEEERLDVLICNAGILYTLDTHTKDGFNNVMQSNYLGHFPLTNLLLDKLKKCQPSRIINVTSVAHKCLSALLNFKTDAIWGSYCPSKACQILSSYKLKHDLINEGVNTFALNPGWVWTSLHDPLSSAFSPLIFSIVYPFLHGLKFILAKTPFIGAQTIVYCAVEPSLQYSTDLYFENCASAKPFPLCTDKEAAECLWKASCDAVGL